VALFIIYKATYRVIQYYNTTKRRSLKKKLIGVTDTFLCNICM